MTNENSALATEEVEKLTEDERGDWLKTGDLPSEKPVPVKTEEPKAEEKAEEPEEIASNFKPAKPIPAKPGQMGYKQLRDRVKELEAKLAEKGTTEEVEDRPARVEAKEAPKEEPVRLKPTMEDKDDKGQPKYKTIEDFFEDLADWKAEKKIADFQKAESDKATKQQTDARQQKIVQKWNGQVEEARKLHADFDKVALNKDLRIPAGSAIEQWVLKSEIGAEIMYALGSDPARIEAINAMDAVDAARELVLIEAELTGDEPTPSSEEKKPESKRVSSAPPPAREVGSRQAINYDPVDEALAEGDFEKYAAAQNAKEIKEKRRR